jgi:exopolyphosphatase/guanosine-5'-triphosphate,3'-diphosphate pyrophosphatase
MEPLFALLTDQQIRDAEVLGKAMRFGAMFSIKSPEDAGKLTWRPKKKILELTLNPDAEALFGEVALARFTSLAQALGAEAKVEMSKR